MLEMRDTCERCSTGLDAAGVAYVCSFECTFCAACAVGMAMRCPNCGGQLVRRPTRSDGLPEGATTTTVSSNTAFFRPVTTGVATGITTPTHVGRKFITVQTEVFDERGKLATRTVQTQAVLSS